MNPRLDLLHPYPFERLRRLLEGAVPPVDLKPINLGIGEPQHPTPGVITQAITDNLKLLGKYPPTAGTPELRTAISEWLARRYAIPAPDPPKEVLPVAGSREALFAFGQAVLDPSDPGVVLLPNPFYQIYEGAAIVAGARPVYVPTPVESGFLPDWNAVPADVWPQVRLVYVCSPGNPCGAVMAENDWRALFELADRYGFVIAADECYSEIYFDEPPMGALEAAHRLGRSNERIVVFNSLSKRSSAPGLRLGFVAGDAEILKKFTLYRTYHGAAPSWLTQVAGEAAWRDEAHVEENREKYRAKFRMAEEVLGKGRVTIPDGGFFLWFAVNDAEQSVRRLYEHVGLTVLPGPYLAREVDGKNPGDGFLRIALVPDLEVCREALERLEGALDLCYV